MLVLRLPTLALYALFLLLSWRLTRRLGGDRWYALLVVAVLALGADRVVKNQLIAGGGYPELNPAGAALALLTVGLCVTGPGARLPRWAAWGLVSGVLLWVDPLILPYVLTLGALLVARRRRELAGRAGWCWPARCWRWRRRTADGSAPGWTAPAAAARWGRWATWTAAVIPVLYALTRFAWVAGIPLGMSRETLAEMRADGAIWAGAGLGAFAVVGAVLTLGLVAGWGERFPRWLPGLAGRRVPVLLAVIPAGLVALAVLAASLDLLAAPQFAELIREGNAAALPMVLWPVWAVTLAGARTRTTCGAAPETPPGGRPGTGRDRPPGGTRILS
nr:hypothetical protein [Micromonospora provocatoris]